MRLGPDRQPRPGRVLVEQVRVAVTLQRLVILAWVIVAIAMAATGILHVVALLWLALLWPLALWRREPPSRRGHLWARPLSRGPHMALRIAAGWLVLVAVAAVHLAVQGFAALAAAGDPLSLGSALTYAAHAMLSVTTLYLLATALSLRFENQVLPAFLLLWFLPLSLSVLHAFPMDPGPVGEAARAVLQHLHVAIMPGQPAGPTAWLPAAAVWLSIALAGCVAALVYQEPHRAP